MNVKDYNWQSS